MPAKKKTRKKPAAKKSDRKKASASRKSPRKRSKRSAKSSSRRTVGRARSTGRYSRTSGGSGAQSGDLQGLSRIPGADSESIDELVEEGNAFEADAVQGVEDADSDRVREVRTHEVPEDDVPDEYLDRDS